MNAITPSADLAAPSPDSRAASVRPVPVDPATRLASLERFLRSDPHNAQLLADAFDAAWMAGQRERAQALLASARAAGHDDAGWTFREVNLLLTQRQHARATALLQGLQAAQGPHPAISHNLAWIAFIDGDFAACCNRLSPWLASGAAGDASLDLLQISALQTLWLRAMHRQSRLNDAWQWVEQQLQAGRLSPAAAGVASLIAVDADHLQDAAALAEAALASDPYALEALVARATVALAGDDPALAQRLLGVALQRHPQDGRALSALGYSALLAGDLAQARQAFESAVVFMPGHVGTWLGLGWARLWQQDRAGAQQAFEQAIALDRGFGESHGSLAVVLALQGQTSAAQRSIERALGLDASNLAARYAQALLAGEAGHGQAVQRLARRLLAGRSAPLGGDMTGWLAAREAGSSGNPGPEGARGASAAVRTDSQAD